MARLVPVALCVVVSALAGVIALELQPGSELPPPPPPNAAPTATPAAASEPVPSAPEYEKWLDTALARPLFATNRRPPSFAPTEQKAATRAKLPRLAGIMIDGPRRSVMFASAGDEKPIVLAEGGSLYGFRVDRIEPGAVTVSGPGVHETLRTSFDSTSPAPPVGPPVPPPSQAAFNGPPGLNRMPSLVTAGTGVVSAPIPGIPGISNMVGIPGLTPPQR